MRGELTIHLADEGQPWYCEHCDHTFGPGYTAHWCPYPVATGPITPQVKHEVLPRWVRPGRHEH